MSDKHIISIDNHKYTFINRGGCRIDVLRHDAPWIEDIEGPNAVASLMYAVDAARVVLEAARTFVTLETLNGRGDDVRALRRALETHDACVGTQPPPTRWARSYCLCAGATDGVHEQDCDRQRE